MVHQRRGYRPRPGTCVYCGQETLVEDDHVFPLCLWPKDQRQGVNFIRAPACRDCNLEKSKYDDALRDRIDLDFTSSIRSDHRHQIETIARSTLYGSSKIGKSAQAAFAHALDNGESPVILEIPVDPEPFLKAVSFIVRGLYFDYTGTPIPTHRATVHVKLVPHYQHDMAIAASTLTRHPGGKLDDTCIWLFDWFPSDPTLTQWTLFFKNGVVFLARTKLIDDMEGGDELTDHTPAVAEAGTGAFDQGAERCR